MPEYETNAPQGYMGDWKRGAPLGRPTIGPDSRSLAELEAGLDPAQFFRANRQMLVAAHAIAHFAPVGKGRLKLTLQPSSEGEVFVSQERAAAFKSWIAG